MFTLHVVCMGNLCRSPIAAALFRARLPVERCTVVSSGLVAQPERTTAPLALQVLRAHGLPVPEMPPRRFDPASVGEDDLVLAMQHRHVRALRALAPQAHSRIQLLGRWTPQREVDDPMGGGVEDFERAFAHIAACVDQWCSRDGRFSTQM
jgi:protein-tyrosine phosphatase